MLKSAHSLFFKLPCTQRSLPVALCICCIAKIYVINKVLRLLSQAGLLAKIMADYHWLRGKKRVNGFQVVDTNKMFVGT